MTFAVGRFHDIAFERPSSAGPRSTITVSALAYRQGRVVNAYSRQMPTLGGMSERSTSSRGRSCTQRSRSAGQRCPQRGNVVTLQRPP